MHMRAFRAWSLIVGLTLAMLLIVASVRTPMLVPSPDDPADADSIVMHLYAVSIVWDDLDTAKRHECIESLFFQARAYAEPRLQENGPYGHSGGEL